MVIQLIEWPEAVIPIEAVWPCILRSALYTILPFPIQILLSSTLIPLYILISTRQFSNSVVRDGPRSRSWQRPWSQGSDIWGGGHRPKTINKYMGSIYQFGRKAKKENEAEERRTRLTRGALFSMGQSEKAPLEEGTFEQRLHMTKSRMETRSWAQDLVGEESAWSGSEDHTL